MGSAQQTAPTQTARATAATDAAVRRPDDAGPQAITTPPTQPVLRDAGATSADPVENTPPPPPPDPTLNAAGSRPNGDACSEAADCASAACVAGVCCAQACDNP